MRATLIALLAPLLLLVPTATAGDVTATSSTGDVDVYPVEPGLLCLPAFMTWTVTLTLVAPSPLDHVLLSVQANGVPTTPPAAVATFDEPTVTVSHFRQDSCFAGAIEVTGLLVEGEVTYTLSSTVGF